MSGTDSTAADQRRVILGRLGRPFGVQGWLRVTSFTEPVENILEHALWQVGRAGQWREIAVEAGRMTAKGVLVKLTGIDTPEAARLEGGADVAVYRSQLPPPPPGEHYWSDLEGLQAFTPQGEALGRVDHFRALPGGHVVVVRGEREHWIPMTRDRIVSVEQDAARVVLDWGVDW